MNRRELFQAAVIGLVAPSAVAATAQRVMVHIQGDIYGWDDYVARRLVSALAEAIDRSHIKIVPL